MKVLVVGPEHLPLPAIEGGAIETLVDYYINYNEKTKTNELTVYSPDFQSIKSVNLKKYKFAKFRYINKKSLIYLIERLIHKIFRFRKQNLSNSYITEVLRDLKKRKELDIYDIILVENEISSIIPIRKNMKGKVIFHLHNDYLNVDTYNANKILKSCDKVLCVSNFISKRVLQIDSSKEVKTVYNGIDVDLFKKDISNDEIKKLKTQFNIDEKDKIILYSGRLMDDKGVLELVKSFKKVLNNFTNLKLLLVGTVRDVSKIDTDEYFNRLKDEIDGFNDKIVLVGKVSYDQIPKLYKISSIQVVPSKWNEAFGLVVIEGMASKNAMIVTDSGGIPEIVNKNSAIIVNRDNLELNLEKALIEILSNPSKMEKMINISYKDVENFTIEKYCMGVEKELK